MLKATRLANGRPRIPPNVSVLEALVSGAGTWSRPRTPLRCSPPNSMALHLVVGGCSSRAGGKLREAGALLGAPTLGNTPLLLPFADTLVLQQGDKFPLVAQVGLPRLGEGKRLAPSHTAALCPQSRAGPQDCPVVWVVLPQPTSALSLFPGGDMKVG